MLLLFIEMSNYHPHTSVLIAIYYSHLTRTCLEIIRTFDSDRRGENIHVNLLRSFDIDLFVERKA